MIQREKTPYEEQLEAFERQRREQQEQAGREWEQQQQRTIDEFNANLDNIPDQSVYRLDWHYEVWYPYFAHKAIIINGLSVEVFNYTDGGYLIKQPAKVWGYSLIYPEQYDDEFVRDFDNRDWNNPNAPHYATVTEAIKAAQDAAVVYLEEKKQEFDEAIARLKSPFRISNNP